VFWFFFFFFFLGIYLDRVQVQGLALLSEGIIEGSILSTVEDTSDGQKGRAVVVLEVLLSRGNSVELLVISGTLADPDEDLMSAVKDEDVVVVELGLLDVVAFSDLVEGEGARGIGQLPQLAGGKALLLGLVIRTTLVGGLNGVVVGSSEDLVEVSSIAVLVAFAEREDGDFALALGLDGVADFTTLVLLHHAASLALPLVESKTVIEDEDIARVEGLGGKVDLHGADLLLALEVHKTGNILLGLDVLESRVNTSLHDVDGGEVAEEEVGLVTLDLTMLDGSVIKKSVELDGLVGSGTGLILAGVGSEPEVEIPLDLVLALLFVGVEDNVRVTRVERAELVLGPADNLELLNAPDLKANFLTGTLPGILGLGGFLFGGTIFVTAKTLNVGIVQVVNFRLKHLQ